MLHSDCYATRNYDENSSKYQCIDIPDTSSGPTTVCSREVLLHLYRMNTANTMAISYSLHQLHVAFCPRFFIFTKNSIHDALGNTLDFKMAANVHCICSHLVTLLVCLLVTLKCNCEKKTSQFYFTGLYDYAMRPMHGLHEYAVIMMVTSLAAKPSPAQ